MGLRHSLDEVQNLQSSALKKSELPHMSQCGELADAIGKVNSDSSNSNKVSMSTKKACCKGV